MSEINRPIATWTTAIVAILFGALTIKSGGAVLFFDEAARQAAGHYVPFVLWFNFLAGFFYIITGLGLWARQRWAVTLAIGLAATTLAVFAAFGLHILNGGVYEMRTVIAMTLRSTVWLTIAITSWRLWRRGTGIPE
jgi:uncharacterized membrane protein